MTPAPETGSSTGKTADRRRPPRPQRQASAHGGAWKVAYADFVTAMMALFIVLWLMSSDEEVKKAVSAFFNNPSGPGNLTGTAAAGAGQFDRGTHARICPSCARASSRPAQGAQIQQSQGPRRNHRHLGRPAHRAAGVGSRRVFRTGQADPIGIGEEPAARLAGELGQLAQPYPDRRVTPTPSPIRAATTPIGNCRSTAPTPRAS